MSKSTIDPSIFHTMFLHLMKEIPEYIDRIEPQGDCAMYIHLSKNITDDVLFSALNGTGWHITRRKDEFAAIEHRYTKSHPLKPGHIIFHVSDTCNRKSILKKGLVPAKGGNTALNRSYPPRVFFAADILAAFEFIDFQCQGRPASYKNGVYDRPPEARMPSDLDLYRVTAPAGVSFYIDPFFPMGKAIWCDEPIPQDNLSLVGDWPSLRAAIARLIEDGPDHKVDV